MDTDLGTVPIGGFARMVPELIVTDLGASQAFWCDILGFNVAYQRPSERFVYLEHAGAQMMLRQRDGKWETGSMDLPLGRGVMFQIEVSDLEAVLKRINVFGCRIHSGPNEVWRQIGDHEGGQREVFLQDPDGYLVMMNQSLGQRPLPDPAWVSAAGRDGQRHDEKR